MDLEALEVDRAAVLESICEAEPQDIVSLNPKDVAMFEPLPPLLGRFAGMWVRTWIDPFDEGEMRSVITG